MNKQVMRIIIMFLCMMIPIMVYAHSNFSSTSYIGEDDVNDSGGGDAASTSFNIQASVGQSAQGAASSSSFILNAGFLCPIPAAASDDDDGGDGGSTDVGDDGGSTDNGIDPIDNPLPVGGGGGGQCFIGSLMD